MDWVTKFAILCSFLALSAESYTTNFSSDRNTLSTDDIRIILEAMHDAIKLFSGEQYYPVGSAFIDFVTVTNNVVVNFIFFVYEGGQVPDYCRVGADGQHYIRGRVLQATLGNILHYCTNQMLLYGASKMLSVMDVVGIDYVIAHTDQGPTLDFFYDYSNTSVETMEDSYKTSMHGLPRRSCVTRFTTLDSGFYNLLPKGYHLTTSNNYYSLGVEDDCSVAVKAGGKEIWRNGYPRLRDVNCGLRIQTDGNMVMFERSSKRVIWAVNKLCQGLCYTFLTIQDDGNAVLYHAAMGFFRRMQQEGSQSEGLNARLYISERKDLLEKLESLVRKERAVLVRTPPQSGKISLLQLLKYRTESKLSDVFCISLAGISGHSFEYMWHQHYPHVPIERLNSSEPTLVLVDEGQSGFHAPDITLWAKIKSAQAGGMLHIVLVSSVASDEDDTDVPPTPIIFKPSCAVTLRPQHGCESSGLYLHLNAECMELWQNWCKFCGFVPSNNDILYYVMEVGDRQPGLMTHMLDWLVRGMLNDKNRADCEEFAKRELLSERFMESLSEIRSICTFRHRYWQPEYAGSLSKLLGSSSALGFVKKTELSSEVLSAANMLLRRGQLVRTKAMNFMFPSPLHRHYFASLCATATLTLPKLQTMCIESFLVHVIQRMSAGRLVCSESLATDDGTIYERQYQNEFYRAYCTLFDVPMFLDVGRLYGAAGHVDFYLAALKWAFEIARDGIKLGELKGRYHALISKGVVKKYMMVTSVILQA
ncbi:hypothetical protein SELMODRAFT_425020 [Selaginella moellendorffii]|uniref:Bulb-type lectin domain-containing protein n=1 Tax=Selaginella moellendorffii TaxID=88036 RepID=D8SRS1_SELML|nr:hypothetical protein SELMODRAFT_425020 [Selaginella moellendorffii]